MLALLSTRIGLHVAAIVLLMLALFGAAAYWKVAATEIKDLRLQVVQVRQQAAELRAANDDLLAQMRTIRAAEDEANASLLAARRRAGQSQQALHRTLSNAATTDPLVLEQELNRQQADLLRQLQQDTR